MNSCGAQFLSYSSPATFNSELKQGSWSLEALINDRKKSAIGAFLDLDWIIRAASAAEKSLAKGYDTLGPIIEEALAKACNRATFVYAAGRTATGYTVGIL
jgi:hypothetical protein